MKNFLLFGPMVFLILGCSASIYPTYPNAASFDYLQNLEAKALLQQLDSMDANLALEVGRLPEFQQNIKEPQTLALTRFINLITDAFDVERANLAKLLQIGIPKVRKYSAPLQAIFWVLEKKADEDVLRYSLTELLDKAWDFSDSRWEDFDAVTDRLNAPRLIDYYERKRFTYGLRTERPGDLKWLFKMNVGMCDEITHFTLICLWKGGYKAAANFSLVPFWDHHATVFKGKNGTFYVIDNGRRCKKGIVKLSQYRSHYSVIR
jgi:hypothetical protein